MPCPNPRSPRSRAPEADHGFTLAELIVASTLISIIMIGVYTTFSTALRSWQGGDANYRTYEDARLALGLLSRELQAIPPGTLHLIEASDDAIEFFTLSRPLHTPDGTETRVLRVRYRVKSLRSGNGGALMREEAIVESALPVWPHGESDIDTTRIRVGQRHEFEIATGVIKMEMRHYWIPKVKRERNEPPRKLDLIIETDHRRGWGLPAGIEIALSLHDPNAHTKNESTTFTSFVVFRGPTSPLPRALDETWGDWGRN